MSGPRLVLSSFLTCAVFVAACSGSDGSAGDGGSGGVPAAAGGGASAGESSSGAGGSLPSAGSPSGGSGGGAGSELVAGGAGGEAGHGGAGPEPVAECNAETPSGCRRGMYLSPYTDGIGQITFAGDDLVYAHILGDAVKEQHLLDFITAQQIDSLSLYNLNVILADDELSAALEDLIGRARQQGVERVEAIGAEGTAIWDAIHAFHHEQSAFDGFVTELEFWGGAVTFEDFIDTLEYVRSLDWADAPSGGQPTLSAYLGWPDEAEVAAMAPLLDRVYLHLYVDTAAQAYGYGAERFALFAAANAELSLGVEVWPIFSAEDNEYAAGAEAFMGEWLRDNGVAQAELEFLGDWAAADWGDGLKLGGHQYYEYFFLDKYVD